MRYESAKSFGYPVLRQLVKEERMEDADYIKASFQPIYEFRIDEEKPDEFILSYDFAALSLKPLQEAIKEGKADYVIRIESRSTYYAITQKS